MTTVSSQQEECIYTRDRKNHPGLEFIPAGSVNTMKTVGCLYTLTASPQLASPQLPALVQLCKWQISHCSLSLLRICELANGAPVRYLSKLGN